MLAALGLRALPSVRLQLAGLGSRFIAGGTDLVIQTILTVILALVTGAVTGTSGVSAVVYVIGAFVITLLYPILFELLHAGRTPGKQLTHRRVLGDTGAPVDLPASAIRNLMRLIDGPLLLYLPTIASIVVTRRNQRPGDLAAGTIVTREERPRALPRHDGPAGHGDSIPRWDTSAVTAAETAAVRRFLERRESLDDGARRQLAARLAAGLRPKVTAPSTLAAEPFLEELLRAKRTS